MPCPTHPELPKSYICSVLNSIFMKPLRVFSIIFLFVAMTSWLHGAAQTITTICGDGTAGFIGDGGPATAAELNSPVTISWGGEGVGGNLYVADGGNNRVRKIKLGGGIIITIAGNGTAGNMGDGALATNAEINIPAGVTIDFHNNVFIGDINNSVVRKVNSGGIISTYSGNGTDGFTGDNGPATAAESDHCYNVVADRKGNIYYAELYNNRIRKVDTFGIITTYAGTGTAGTSGDGGPATAALIYEPNFLSIDAIGQLYITDNGNHKIRRVDTFGIITTIAGNGTGGFSGDGGPATAAELYYPAGTATDMMGNILICDSYNDRIRKIDTATGHITTIAGTGVTGYTGDNGSATAATMNKPHGIIVDNLNNIYFTDRYNNCIRKITEIPTAITDLVNENYSVYPNPTTGIVNLSGQFPPNCNIAYSVTNMYGQIVMKGQLYGKQTIDLSALQNGCYRIKANMHSSELCQQILILK